MAYVHLAHANYENVHHFSLFLFGHINQSITLNVQNAKFVQKFVHILLLLIFILLREAFSQGLSRNFVRIFVLQNLYTEPFFSNMTATETATEKVRHMYCTFLQVLQVLQTDCRS